jgi:hypothetical protein
MYRYYVSLSNYSINTKHYKKVSLNFYSFDKYVLYIIFQNNKKHIMDSMLVIIGFCCMLIGVIGLSSCGAWSTYELDRASAPLFYNCDSSKLLDSQHYIMVTIITSILEYIIRPEEQNEEEVPMAFGEQISD